MVFSNEDTNIASFSNISQRAKGVTSIEKQLQQRAEPCSQEIQHAFVDRATRANDAFEDAYFLALGTSRIALSPIVADMQEISREVAQLKNDYCSKLVQENLVIAYEDAIQMFLDFMQEREVNSQLTVTRQLRDATQLLEAYKMSPVSAIAVHDILTAGEIAGTDNWPEELEYLKPIPDLEQEVICQEYEFVIRIFQDVYAASWDRYRDTDRDETPDMTMDNTCQYDE